AGLGRVAVGDFFGRNGHRRLGSDRRRQGQDQDQEGQHKQLQLQLHHVHRVHRAVWAVYGWGGVVRRTRQVHTRSMRNVRAWEKRLTAAPPSVTLPIYQRYIATGGTRVWRFVTATPIAHLSSHTSDRTGAGPTAIAVTGLSAAGAAGAGAAAASASAPLGRSTPAAASVSSAAATSSTSSSSCSRTRRATAT